MSAPTMNYSAAAKRGAAATRAAQELREALEEEPKWTSQADDAFEVLAHADYDEAGRLPPVDLTQKSDALTWLSTIISIEDRSARIFETVSGPKTDRHTHIFSVSTVSSAIGIQEAVTRALDNDSFAGDYVFTLSEIEPQAEEAEEAESFVSIPNHSELSIKLSKI